MKTAMQELIEELEKINFEAEFEEHLLIDKLFKEALEKEKEQIMMAYNDAIVNTVFNGKRKPEQYYKDTYDRTADTK